MCGRIDKTRTKLGSQALKARIRSPYVGVSEIRQLQECLEFLRTHAQPVPFDDELLHGVDRYRRSNIEISERARSGRTFAVLQLAIRHREVLGELSRGIIFTGTLATRLVGFCSTLIARNPGNYLNELLRDTAEVAAEIAAVASEFGGAPWRVTRQDAQLRGSQAENLRQLVESAAQIDALTAMAAFGQGLDFCIPELVDGNLHFEAVGLWHPLLAKPIGNAVRLDGDSHVIFLTGPNMAGKTTFLKSVGVAQVLAQVGLLVPAKALRFTPVEAVFTAINTSDDIGRGVSYYLAEVQRVRQAAQLLADGRRALVLLDEAFRGTNVLDATEATRSVICACARLTDSSFIFASHLAELGPELGACGVALRAFSGDVRDGVPVYEYRMHEGVSDQRLGLLLLKQERVLDLLAEAAQGKAS